MSEEMKDGMEAEVVETMEAEVTSDEAVEEECCCCHGGCHEEGNGECACEGEEACECECQCEAQGEKDKKDLLIDELKDKYIRTMAEFDNFRKRTEKEKSSMYEIGAKDIVEKILPVLDNFERGFMAVTEEEKATPFVEGMDRIYKQLVKTLQDAGVEEIACEGQEFDPNLHNAVMHVEDENLGENVVAEVLQKGYTYRGNVVRHSMVKVAN